MKLDDGDLALCKHCGKSIAYDKPYRSWYHSDTDEVAPDDMYCEGAAREDDDGNTAEPVES